MQLLYYLTLCAVVVAITLGAVTGDWFATGIMGFAGVMLVTLKETVTWEHKPYSTPGTRHDQEHKRA